MNKRFSAVASSVFNSFCDFNLDVAINEYNMYKVLLYSSIISFLIQIIYSFFSGISITISSIPVILVYGLIILLGYMCYVKSLKCLPIGLIALLENSDLFIVLIIDIFLGNIKLSLKFIILFILFVFSVFWFTIETNNIEKNEMKKIKYIGFVFIFLSILFYAIEPYIIKYAMKLGANEVAINFGYSFLAIPFFFFKCKKDDNLKSDDKRFINLMFIIGFCEAFYYILGTIGYMYESAVIVNIIGELRVFLLVILSVIFKLDKMNLKKFIATILGIISITLIYFI